MHINSRRIHITYQLVESCSVKGTMILWYVEFKLIAPVKCNLRRTYTTKTLEKELLDAYSI